MPQNVVKELETIGICAIINIKSHILEMISRLTQGKVLETIDQAS
jgi:hypothetical protein